MADFASDSRKNLKNFSKNDVLERKVDILTLQAFTEKP